MKTSKSLRRCRAACALALLALAGWAQAQDLRVAAPNAVKEALTAVAARFSQDSGRAVRFTWGGSEAITRRVADGEAFDVVVNTAAAVDRLSADGRLVQGSRTDFARSAVAAAVREGLPRPDLSSPAALKAALLAAPSIAISSGASGRYLEQLFQQLGVGEQIKARIRQPPSGTNIGDMLARGEADLGFQQTSELVHAHGIQYLGPLPAELQFQTVWAAGVHTATPQLEAAQAFARALAAPASAAGMRETGLEPI